MICLLSSSNLTLLKMLMRTRKSVTRRAILPGTTSGLIRKLTQLVTTNMKLGRYTWAQRGDEHSSRSVPPVTCIWYCICFRCRLTWKPQAA